MHLLPGRFFQVPKRLLEQLQAQPAGVGEELLDGDEGAEGVEEQEQQQGASSSAASDKDPVEAEKWQQFDDLVESWLVRGVEVACVRSSACTLAHERDTVFVLGWHNMHIARQMASARGATSGRA